MCLGGGGCLESGGRRLRPARFLASGVVLAQPSRFLRGFDGAALNAIGALLLGLRPGVPKLPPPPPAQTGKIIQGNLQLPSQKLSARLPRPLVRVLSLSLSLPPICPPPRLVARALPQGGGGCSLEPPSCALAASSSWDASAPNRRLAPRRRVVATAGRKKAGLAARASPNQEGTAVLLRRPFVSRTTTRATPLSLPFAMGLPLLLGLLLSRAGGFQVMSFEQPNNCLTAETLCLAEPSCSATYQILQNCSQHLSQNSYIFLYHEAKNRCTEAQIKMRHSHFQHCKCHQRAQKKEGRCLQIYQAVYATLTQDDFHLEVLPHRDRANKEAMKIKYNKLATRVSGSYRTKDSPNSCLLAANTCQLDHKCMRQRSQYAQACTTGYPCDQRICHRNLRHFFDKVGVDFTKRLLFCPCQDEACGERRWQTIVPQCSFLSSRKPNCLFLLDACSKDNVCRSRLAVFQEKCKSLQAFTDGCSPLNYAACLQAYMKMIGTSLTPNYVSNSSTEITLWCSCTNSGNHKEDCDQILNLFSSNKCLNNAIQAEMNLGQKNKEVQDQPQFTPSLDIQGDGTSTMFTEKLYQKPEVKEEKKDSEILTLNQKSPSNSEYPRAQFSSFILILTLAFLFLGPP